MTLASLASRIEDARQRVDPELWEAWDFFLAELRSDPDFKLRDRLEEVRRQIPGIIEQADRYVAIGAVDELLTRAMNPNRGSK